jgi:hypothetical protein
MLAEQPGQLVVIVRRRIILQNPGRRKGGKIGRVKVVGDDEALRAQDRVHDGRHRRCRQQGARPAPHVKAPLHAILHDELHEAAPEMKGLARPVQLHYHRYRHAR